jgi:hypothetical protein
MPMANGDKEPVENGAVHAQEPNAAEYNHLLYKGAKPALAAYQILDPWSMGDVHAILLEQPDTDLRCTFASGMLSREPDPGI